MADKAMLFLTGFYLICTLAGAYLFVALVYDESFLKKAGKIMKKNKPTLKVEGR